MTTTKNDPRRGCGGRFAALILLTTSPLLPATLISPCAVSADNSVHAVSRHKSPNASTPPDLVAAWRDEDASLNAYIESTVPAVLEHTGSEAFDAHLRGVQAILRHWGSPRHLSDAGMLHSICEFDITYDWC